MAKNWLKGKQMNTINETSTMRLNGNAPFSIGCPWYHKGPRLLVRTKEGQEKAVSRSRPIKSYTEI